jgi:hypothetical protein
MLAFVKGIVPTLPAPGPEGGLGHAFNIKFKKGEGSARKI